MFIIDAINVLCAQLTRDLFAIAKFLFQTPLQSTSIGGPLEYCHCVWYRKTIEWCGYLMVKKN